jgi:hypothetical protein
MMMILGITDEHTTCELCGRMELKSTVIIGEDGVETGRYGSSCASKILGRKIAIKAARNIESVRRSNLAEEMRNARKAKAAGDMEAFAYHGKEILRLMLHPEEKAALRALCAS